MLKLGKVEMLQLSREILKTRAAIEEKKLKEKGSTFSVRWEMTEELEMLSDVRPHVLGLLRQLVEEGDQLH